MECIVLMHNGCKGKLKDRQKKPLHNGQSPSDNEERSYLSEERKELGVGKGKWKGIWTQKHGNIKDETAVRTIIDGW